ncbi:MAG: nucleotidyl transferase AbiEii/AbiGii toxin family protein [Polyangiaceae bacterium]|nr:nucleotidyl transferase AbiEii/AbiGii toxin family protein [Polyangiaceae bacterium]
MNAPTIETTLADIARTLRELGRPFALVGGLAVSFRAEVRFTRDIDLAVAVQSDADFESLVFALRACGYFPVATVEHKGQARLSTARLQAPNGFVVDLLAASCGIEHEIVKRATVAELPNVGPIPVARSEELLAMKILSMSDRRLQDRLDARNLALFGDQPDWKVVEGNLHLITDRGFNRGEDLFAKLRTLLDDKRVET